MLVIEEYELRKVVCDYNNCSDSDNKQYPECSIFQKGKCVGAYLYDRISEKSLYTGDVRIVKRQEDVD